jgi:hypothetical protein
LGVVLVRSAPTTFHNLLWTTLLRFKDSTQLTEVTEKTEN